MNTLRISGHDVNFWFHMLKRIFRRKKPLETEISDGRRIRFISIIQGGYTTDEYNKIRKHPSTWFMTPEELSRTHLEYKEHQQVCWSILCNQLWPTGSAEGQSTNFVEFSGKSLTSCLWGLDKFTADKGCVFTSKWNGSWFWL